MIPKMIDISTVDDIDWLVTNCSKEQLDKLASDSRYILDRMSPDDPLYPIQKWFTEAQELAVEVWQFIADNHPDEIPLRKSNPIPIAKGGANI